MTVWKCAAAVAVAVLVACPLMAEESVNGRWAADPAACSFFGASAAQSPLIVTEYAVRWHEDACRIARVYKTGDTVHIQALCWGDSGERSIPVSLRPHAGKLSVTWDRGARGELKRCP
ncbi:MAG: hypothetical protein ABI830_14405 [Pseudolabrys sp.]